MGVFDGERELALELIAEFGEVCVWSQTGEGVVTNPDEPWNQSPNVPVLHEGISIAFFPLSETDLKMVQLILKTEVPTSLEKGYMGYVPFKPGLKDIIIRADGRKMRMVPKLGELNPNGEGAVLYQIVVQE